MKKLFAGTTAVLLLSGCQSIFGHHAKLEVRPIGAEIQPAQSSIALEEGRQFLRDGQVASAIASFRAAALDITTAPQAHNGLAVAYAMLDRGDLAERYFQAAIAEDPGDPRFAANLARFYRTREAAMAKSAAVPAVEPASATEPDAVAAADEAAPLERQFRAGPSVVRITLPTPSAALTRVSRQEVAIRTSPAEPPAVSRDPRRRNPQFGQIAAPRARQAYPVRLDLAALAKR
ncbi:tetratricopeptide repeat protein [Novosphingobium sp. Gsoil 351]|uniref:tetratricopeptide repeat protein n=1 Tax=Novosphingobium sp. Gsoil 351 TaxID=2675225 RepID=UPI0012B46685|nr:tetratricopeptide repeat protein [Novosphingobium sp. Gsoil 351]QGN54461.1 hypothetical protein GKE62_07725 [Novosphingobium sp. Gsoil 351]